MPVSEEEYCWYKNLINSVFIQSTCRNEALLAPSAFAALRSLPWHHGDFISLPSPTRRLGIRKVANHGRHPMPRAPALSSKNRPPSLDLVCYLHWPLPPSPHRSTVRFFLTFRCFCGPLLFLSLTLPYLIYFWKSRAAQNCPCSTTFLLLTRSEDWCQPPGDLQGFVPLDPSFSFIKKGFLLPPAPLFPAEKMEDFAGAVGGAEIQI